MQEYISEGQLRYTVVTLIYGYRTSTPDPMAAMLNTSLLYASELPTSIPTSTFKPDGIRTFPFETETANPRAPHITTQFPLSSARCVTIPISSNVFGPFPGLCLGGAGSGALCGGGA